MNSTAITYYQKLQIAGIRILVKSELPFTFSKRCLPFQSDFAASDVVVHLSLGHDVSLANFELVCQEELFDIFQLSGEHIKIKYADSKKKKICWILRYHTATPYEYTIQVFPAWKSNLDALNPLFFFELSEFLIQYDAIILHSSVINYQGHGIVFTAPSGTGKSTQAKLWQTYCGADILNGDRTIIRKTNKYQACGSPYAGSSGIYKNQSVPLTAIVVLGQSSKNTLRKLRAKEAYVHLLSEMSVSNWNKSVLIRQTDWLLELLQVVPVYRLDCLPEQSAVALLCNELKLGDQFASK